MGSCRATRSPVTPVQLTCAYDSDAPRPALVWGRRRVGKTALIQHFADGRRAVFHTGAGRTPRDELRHLSKSILRSFLDRTHGHTKLRILLCGSAVRSMEALQEQRAPLYGRFDLRLLVHPFAPSEAAALLDGLSATDAALVYGLLGGMPLYLSWWRAELSLTENLMNLFGHAGAALLNEGELILATEVEPSGRPAAALRAIASGKTRYGEVKDAIGAEPARTLDRLIELRLVERTVPVTDDPRRSKRRIYGVTDNFLSFYLHVVDRYRGEIERGLGESIMPTLLTELDDHMGKRWEAMIRDHVRALCARGELAADVVAVGPWWRDDGGDEIDIVALAGRERRPVLVGEAKWARRVDARRLVRGLVRKATAVTEEPESLTYVVGAHESVDHADESVVPITAADVFGV